MDILKRGSIGPEVQLLQAILQRLGIYQDEITGIFDNNTFQAVKNFQANQGGIVDGIVGPRTWRILTPYITGYYMYTIRPGDTLSKIAQKLHSSESAIVTANPGISNQSLIIGNSIAVPLSNFSGVYTNVSFTSHLLQLTLQGLKTRFPFIRVNTIGYSVYRNPIYSVDIGVGSHRVFYNASHHANEWITTPVLLKFLEDYCNSYVNNDMIYDQRAVDVYAATTISLVPMVNPDGVDLVTGAIAPESELYMMAQEMASAYPDIPFPSGWKANLAGVDLNLNYPAGWEKAREIKGAAGFLVPGPRDYVGPAPLSEPESKAISAFTLNNDFMLTISYHTQGNIIYWKYADYLPPQSYEIGKIFSNISGYPLETTPDVSGNAGYKDWYIQTYNRPGYTIEVGVGASPVPIDQFDDIYGRNLGILVAGALV